MALLMHASNTTLSSLLFAAACGCRRRTRKKYTVHQNMPPVLAEKMIRLHNCPHNFSRKTVQNGSLCKTITTNIMNIRAHPASQGCVHSKTGNRKNRITHGTHPLHKDTPKQSKIDCHLLSLSSSASLAL